jgi:hypothetical protein
MSDRFIMSIKVNLKKCAIIRILALRDWKKSVPDPGKKPTNYAVWGKTLNENVIHCGVC